MYTEVQSANVSGGDEVYERGGYMVHVFRSSGTLRTDAAVDVEVLLVGGGGAGMGSTGLYASGGGGGGGVLLRQVRISPGQVAIKVGKGGVGIPGDAGTRGEDSTFGDLVAHGGGGASANNPSGVGGSGAGGRSTSQGLFKEVLAFVPSEATQGKTPYGGYGNPGGVHKGTGGMTMGAEALDAAAGGGGAGTPGGDATSHRAGEAGKGGDGIELSITGEPIYYAAGGGGGTMLLTTTSGPFPGQGGRGGGGAGRSGRVNGLDARGIGSGGGGSGLGSASQPVRGGNGGTGIVVVRYPTPRRVESYRSYHA